MDYDKDFFEIMKAERFEELTAYSARANKKRSGIAEVHCLEGSKAM
jgi:hypothetical protein